MGSVGMMADPQTGPAGMKTPAALFFSFTDKSLARTGVRTSRDEVGAASLLPLSSRRLQRDPGVMLTRAGFLLSRKPALSLDIPQVTLSPRSHFLPPHPTVRVSASCILSEYPGSTPKATNHGSVPPDAQHRGQLPSTQYL